VSEQSATEGKTGLAGGGVPAEQLPRDDEPGGESTPLDTEGAGPVGLEDRTRTDEKGSPATNQAKAEPIAPTPGHRDPTAPLTPPLLQDMNVGAGDPQAPSHRAAASAAPTTGAEPPASAGPGNAPTDLTAGGSSPQWERPLQDTASSTGRATGPENPLSATPGSSHKAPGMQGAPSPAEEVETDAEDSAAAMTRDTGRPSGGGDPRGVGMPGEVPGEGTSGEHGVVQGARIPRSD
jgi:hypothetical protein